MAGFDPDAARIQSTDDPAILCLRAEVLYREPADLQIRNIVAMRRIDPQRLAAVGVRFVTTDHPYEGELRLRQTLDIPVSEAYLKRAGIVKKMTDFSLYLYELTISYPTEPFGNATAGCRTGRIWKQSKWSRHSRAQLCWCQRAY